MKKIATLLLILSTTLFSSCGSNTTYRPSIYGHDYLNSEIITPVTHKRISCSDKDFNKYVSVSLKDLTKLAMVLKYGKFPRKVRILIEAFRKELNFRNESQSP